MSIFSLMIQWKVCQSRSQSKKGWASTSTALMRSSLFIFSIFSRRSRKRGQTCSRRCSARVVPLTTGSILVICSLYLSLLRSFEPSTRLMFSRQSKVLDPLNISLLVTSQTITQPIAQISTALVYSPLPSSNSGARYDLELRQAMLYQLRRMTFADPKSQSTTLPFFLMRKFQGFTSRWVTPFVWTQQIALAIWQQMTLKIRYQILSSPRISSFRFQSQRSMRMLSYVLPDWSCLQMSMTLTTKLLLSLRQISSSLLQCESSKRIFLRAQCLPVYWILTRQISENWLLLNLSNSST